MSNRTTLAQLNNMNAGEISAIPLDHIELLLEELADLQRNAKSFASTIQSELNRRFADSAANIRKLNNKDTGTVRFARGDYTIVADLPKKVEWDQAKLDDARFVIQDEWNGNPAEYVDVKYSVSETKFNSWPEPIRKLFEPARTVGVGTATFKLEQKKDAA